MNMNENMLEKTVETLGNVTKIAANLSEPKKEAPKKQQSDDSNNACTGNQSVNISVAPKEKKPPKPVERHIHEFPENRELNERECELALQKARMDFELKKQEQDHINRMDERSWQHQMELEKKQEKKARKTSIIGSILVALGIGALGYCAYKDSKGGCSQAKGSSQEPVKAEGTVQ